MGRKPISSAFFISLSCVGAYAYTSMPSTAPDLINPDARAFAMFPIPTNPILLIVHPPNSDYMKIITAAF